MDKSHEEVIQQTVAHIKANLSNPISVAKLARKMGYSPSYLRFIFRESTGKGLLPLIIDMRIQRVKELLNDTGLSISDISFAAGFTSLKQLCTMFRKKVGCSPTEYRKSLGLAAVSRAGTVGEAAFPEKPWRYESLKNPKWNPAFKAILGDWQQNSASLSGSSENQAQLRFEEPLPENFRITFDVRLTPKAHLPSAEIDIWIQNAAGNSNYCIFVLGKLGGTTGELRPRDFGSQLNPKAILKRDTWHKIELELQDDSVFLSIDNERMFTYKDPFPPPYSWRSNFCIGTYHGLFEMREFVVYDTGILPLVKSVRQGDSLYNAGLFSSARESYLRLLGSKTSTIDMMELRYKIGRCLLGEKDYFQARTWMDKVVRLPETRFWADHAELALLQIDIREEIRKDIRDRALIISKQEPLRNGLREILDEAANGASARGFFEQAADFHGIMFETEPPGTHSSFMARVRLADTLMILRQYQESADHFLAVINDPAFPISICPFPCFSLCDNYAIQGKREEWKSMLQRLGTFNIGSEARARLICYWAIYHRASGEFEQAIAELLRVEKLPPPVSYWLSFSSLLTAQILCCTGKTQRARVHVEKAIRSEGGCPWAQPGRRSWYLGVVEIADGNFEGAAQLSLGDSQLNQGTWMGAAQSVNAGILKAIAGQPEEANAIWKKTPELFTERQVNFFGALARELLMGHFEFAFKMPYAAEKRSEVFFLLGVLCEKQHDSARARGFFEQCLKEDKLLHWPTHMAKNKLECFPTALQGRRDPP